MTNTNANITAALTSALDQITDPIAGKGLMVSGRAAAPRFADGRASVILDVTGLNTDTRSRLEREITTAFAAISGVSEMRVAMTSSRTGAATAQKKARLIAVASGKGGVGKSTVSANLAVALARMGKKVGVVDADIYGPSQPRLLGVEGTRPHAVDQKLEPVATPFAVGLLSMGQLVKPGQAIAWRGPMAGNALSQLVDAAWGDLDFLVIDLPPGTGDVQMSMIQKHKPDGAVIVSTPQDLALMDATRAIDLFNTAGVPIVGLIENMAGYQCPHCGEISDPFGQGGAEAAAKVLNVPFLGRVPLELNIRIASDAGEPPAALADDVHFAALAAKLAAWGSEIMILDRDEDIARLLSSVRTIALVGASDKEDRASNRVMEFLLGQGYTVWPVNPQMAGQQIHGQTVYTALADLPGKADLVDIFRNSEAAGPITDEAIAAGAGAVWMQLEIINQPAAKRAAAAGLDVVMNRCPKIEIPRLGVAAVG